MRILIHGDDSFRNLQAFQETINTFKENHDPEGKNIYAYSSKDDLKLALNLIQQTSLFSSKQLIVIEDCHNFRAVDLDIITQLNQRLNEATILIYRSDKEITGKTKLEQEFLKAETIHLQSTLTGISLQKWIMELAKKFGLTISPAIINRITTVTNDSWVINNLIQQLAAHAKATNKDDSDELIKLLTVSKDESPIFALTEALASGNNKQAVKILHQHLNDGAEPLMILGLLAKHIRDLIAAKNGAKANFKSDYIYSKLNAVAKKFTDIQLINWQQNVILTDIAIKKGQPPLTSINVLVLNMANLNK